MESERNNETHRLEGLLATWGAQQAAGESQPGRCPSITIQQAAPAPAGPSMLRWLPAAVAAALLLAAGGLFVAWRVNRGQPVVREPDRPKTRPGPRADEFAKLQAELRQARGELTNVKASLAAAVAAAGKAGKDESRLKTELLDLENRVTLAESQAASSAKILKEAQHKSDEQAGKLREAERRTKQAATELAKARAAGEDARKKLAQRQEELNVEMDRLRRLHNEAEKARHEAERKLQARKTEYAVMLKTLQKMYLSSYAQGRTGLVARQVAARRSRLLERCMKLRSQVRSSQTRSTFDTLEEALTRLDLLDTARPEDMRRFAGMVQAKRLPGRIDEALARMESEAVRYWLIEAKLILMGAEHVS